MAYARKFRRKVLALAEETSVSGASKRFNVHSKTIKAWQEQGEDINPSPRRLQAEVKREARNRAPRNFEELYEEHRQRFLDIFDKALDEGGKTLSSAVKAAENLAKLDGFLTPKMMLLVADKLSQARQQGEDVPQDPEYLKSVNDVLRARVKREMVLEGWMPPEDTVIDVTPKKGNGDGRGLLTHEPREPL